jgi:hypothetical protein
VPVTGQNCRSPDIPPNPEILIVPIVAVALRRPMNERAENFRG